METKQHIYGKHWQTAEKYFPTIPKGCTAELEPAFSFGPFLPISTITPQGSILIKFVGVESQYQGYLKS